ncbi:transcriptional regulator, MarR family [Sulfuriferula multivorans]|uniref:Transcriptional regulator, MarR family n=1 Tax=Sulfuriferula multivorans TaxID=1559896 RepID=A0A401JGI4_9PROT|nr:MarR family transcriptional regulator [Sulfuriferula multivorans]GBL46734.1 transcriptional regulator, MarR family [Sulfuriferula multivorans]
MDKSAAQFFDLIDRLGNLVRVNLRAAGGQHGLQPVHLQALVYLAIANRYSNTPQALTEYLGLTKGTVSQSLLLLHRRGLIERQGDTDDKRLVRLALSESGAQLLKDIQLLPDWAQVITRIAPQRSKIALAVLKELLLALQLGAGNRSFGVCNTCQHNLHEGPRSYRCGLTEEKLSLHDTRMICREHQPRQKSRR